MNIERYVERLAKEAMKRGLERGPESLSDVPMGGAIELWSDAFGDRFWFVANESDAAKLEESRSTIYIARAPRCVFRVSDAKTIEEVHRWKRRFEENGDE